MMILWSRPVLAIRHHNRVAVSCKYCGVAKVRDFHHIPIVVLIDQNILRLDATMNYTSQCQSRRRRVESKFSPEACKSLTA